MAALFVAPGTKMIQFFLQHNTTLPPTHHLGGQVGHFYFPTLCVNLDGGCSSAQFQFLPPCLYHLFAFFSIWVPTRWLWLGSSRCHTTITTHDLWIIAKRALINRPADSDVLNFNLREFVLVADHPHCHRGIETLHFLQLVGI